MLIADVSWLLPWNSLYGETYQFWSGVGSDIGELAILGAVIGAYRKAECHAQGCHRFGRFAHGHYRLCHVHHPGVPSDGRITAAHIAQVSTSGRAPRSPSAPRTSTTKKEKTK